MTNEFIMTTDDAIKRCEIIFNDAMKRWNTFCQQNYPHLLFKTQISPNIVIWRKIGYRRAGITSCVVSRGSKIYEITMNINYLESADALQFIDSTLRHEIAHVVANLFNGSWGHDKTWKAIAKIMGDSGERCHNYAMPKNTPTRKTQCRKTFICPVCGTEHNLTPLMIKRCMTGKYSCSKCKTGMETFVK